MFDKLEDLVKRLEEVMLELSNPDVVNDQAKFRSLMKEQNDLTPIVEKYKEYKDAKQQRITPLHKLSHWSTPVHQCTYV